MRLSAKIIGAAAVTLFSAAATAQTPSSYVPLSLTTSEMMLEVVADLPNPIWEKSYAPELTDQDWELVKRSASELLAAATLISVGGSDAAEKGWTDSPEWRQWSEKLAETAQILRDAAVARDQMTLQTAGDTLVEDCMGCHVVFDPTAR